MVYSTCTFNRQGGRGYALLSRRGIRGAEPVALPELPEPITHRLSALIPATV